MNTTMNKILVIEDEPMVRSSLVELLEAERFTTFSAIDGFEGIQLAQEQIPDLILCDVMMPDLDGYDVLQMLRKDPETATIPFIFLTAKAALKEVRQGMNLGADDYLTKPFSRNELLQAISVRLEKRDAYLQTTERQFNGLQESITYAIPEKLLNPIEEISQTASFLVQDAATITADDIVRLGLHVRSQAQFLDRAIHNFLLYIQLEFLARDAKSLEALSAMKTLRPGDFVMMMAQQKAKHHQRSRDVKVQVANTPIKIATDDFKRILDESLEFVLSYACANTAIDIKAEPIPSYFQLTFQFQLEHLTMDLAHQLNASDALTRQIYEEIDPGLGILLIQRMAELYKGELRLKADAPEQRVVITLCLPCQI
jgi:two-component system, sensor histidine kinase and response regulator